MTNAAQGSMEGAWMATIRIAGPTEKSKIGIVKK